jgi:hypothetical protein
MVSHVGSPTDITPNDIECLVVCSAIERKRLLALIETVNFIRAATSAA